jgi:hypothetical protein
MILLLDNDNDNDDDDDDNDLSSSLTNVFGMIISIPFGIFLSSEIDDDDDDDIRGPDFGTIIVDGDGGG